MPRINPWITPEEKLKLFIEKSNIVHKNKYDYSKTVYKKAHEKCIIICPTHGEFSQNLIDHSRGSGCKKCSTDKSIKTFKTPKINESLLDKFPELCKEWSDKNEFGPESYKPGSKYRAIWNCSKCNNEWLSQIRHRTNNINCPKCNSSKGEKRIQSFLNNLNIDYKVQYRIKECRNKLPLPFDFAIFKNDNLVVLIEYNGLQHYELSSGIFNCPKKLKILQENDKIKKEYCEKNNIELLIIPYYEFENIENTISNFLSVKGILQCYQKKH